jgi:uncharacterized protein
MLPAIWRILLELSPWLLLGAAIAGLLHWLLPADFVKRWMRGAGGVWRGVLVGVPLPLCSCSVIPVGLGLKKQGASDGATVGFLISTPQTGVDSVLVTASMLGWPFALFKIAAAAVTGLVGGWLTDAVSAPPKPSLELPILEPAPAPRTFRTAVDYALMILQMVWRWLVVGVLVSAVIEVWLPPELFGSLAASTGGRLGAMLVALAVGIPLYVCATASVPIAAALVAGGLPTGAALVFLMAGPATNVATIGAVYRTLGGRVLAVYLGTIIVGSMAGGLLFEHLLPASAITSAHAHHHERFAWWHTVSALVVIALCGYFAMKELTTPPHAHD